MFLKHARNPMFLGMGNHLEPFSKVSEPHEGQEQGGGAVGGQFHPVIDLRLVVNGPKTL